MDNEPALAYRPLGNTGRSVSVLGLGCASYWARPDFPESRARSVLEAALDIGVNVLDTGGSYAGGHAELRLGRILGQLRPDSDSILVATKAGSIADDRGRLGRDFRPESIRLQVEQSLRRLGIERLGLLQLHGPGIDEITDDLLASLDKLREQGKIDLIGVNGSAEIVRAALDTPVFDVVMPFFSVREPRNASLIAAAAGAGYGVLAASPLARMTFSPPLADWLRRRSGLWYLARAIRHNSTSMLRTRGLKSALRFTGWRPAQLALAWVLEQPGVSCAVVGTTRKAHILELGRSAGWRLPDEIRDRLERIHTSNDAV